MNTYVKSILICVMCSILFLAHSQEFKASEDFKEYPSSLVTTTPYISYNDSSYVPLSGVPTEKTFYLQYQFRLNEPIDARSVIQFDFGFVLEEGLANEDVFFTDVEFLRCNVMTKNWSVIKMVPSGYFRIDETYGYACNTTTGQIPLGGTSGSEAYIIAVYLKVSVSKTTNILFDHFNMIYQEPDPFSDLVNPSPEDEENVNNSNDSMIDNKNEMDSMINDMASVPEPDVDDLTANLDKYLPAEHITTFSSVLSALFQNDIVIAYVMIGLVVALVSFVLFGKKG